MDILQLLFVAYGGEKADRTDATAQLDAALQSPDGPAHFVTLLRAGADPSLPAEQSLSALICAKNCIMDTISEEQLTAAPALLNEAKALLYTGALRAPASHRSVISACVATMISAFEWDYLPELLPEITRERAGVPVEDSLAALHLLYVGIKRFKLAYFSPVTAKLEVCERLLPALPPFFAYGDLRVDHMVFKVMECVVLTALQSTGARAVPPGALDVWFSLMASHPEQYFAAMLEPGAPCNVRASYIRCLKRIAIISFSILNDATRRKRPVAVGKHFLTNHAGTFFGVWQRWLEYSAAKPAMRSEYRKVDIYAMRYIKLCTLDAKLYQQHLHPNIMSVIESLLFPFLCFGGEDDEAAFAEGSDLGDFVQYMTEEGYDRGEVSQRQAASNAISALVGTKKKFHDPAVLQKLIEALTAGLSRPDTAETFPQIFGFMHLLSILRKHLRAVPEIWHGQMAKVLVAFVAPRVLPTVPFVPLRCKALVVCQRYSKAPIASEEDFASFIQLICALVQDENPRIRLGAIDSMCTLLEMKRARPYMSPILIPLVNECIDFLNRVVTTFVPTVLLYLTEHFAPELTPVLGKIGSTLAQHFLATAFDLAQRENGELNESDMLQYERTDFGAVALLNALLTVVISSAHNVQAFEGMRPDLLRVVRGVMEHPDSMEFLDKTLVIYEHVINISKPIPPEWWDVLPLVFKSVDDGIGVDYFTTIEEVLDNYISNATIEYLQNTDLMTASFLACEKMLLGGVLCSSENQIAAPMLIEAMLHQAKHCTAAPGLFDPYLPRFVGLLLRSLADDEIRNGEVRLQLWIIAAVMDAFYYDAVATLRIIVESNAFPHFFDAFFHFFCGVIKPAGKEKDQKNTKSGAKKSKRREDSNAQGVVDELSILTRKVIALGLTALLHAAAAQPSFDVYVEPTLLLIQHCIFRNDELYTSRCRISEDNIARIRRGAIEEEDVEDVDLNDEDVLGLDGGDDMDECDEEDEAVSDDNSEDGLHCEEGDDYESPIDDVCEAAVFLEWASTVSALGGAVQLHMQRALHRSEEDFRAAVVTAQRYRELVKELDRAVEEDFKSRSAVPTVHV